jgi:hypothetical protein
MAEKGQVEEIKYGGKLNTTFTLQLELRLELICISYILLSTNKEIYAIVKESTVTETRDNKAT